VPNDTEALRDSIAALSGFFVGEGTLAETLQRVADLTAKAVPPAAMTGITMLVDGKPATAVFTDETAPEIDQAQYETGSGPCLDAFRDGCVYRIDRTEDEDRWPEFAKSAFDHGIRSTLSLPMVAWERGIGALNCYSRDEAAFTEADEVAGTAFARQASIALANAQAYWDAHDLSENLAEAMRSRAVIEQAKGVLVERSGVDADGAFDVLKRASQRSNRKLRDIAAEIVARAGTAKGGRSSP
jgi:GAF domain-containing protein